VATLKDGPVCLHPPGGAGTCSRYRSRDPGLSPVTLSNYTRPGRSTLERGVDFTIRRSSQWRRHLVFTDRGVARLLARDYSVSWKGGTIPDTFVPAGAKRQAPLESFSVRERKMRMKSHLANAWQKYLERGGCAVPRCPCMIHNVLNIPQADYIAMMLPPVKKKPWPR
jgi:hypothetical protein